MGKLCFDVIIDEQFLKHCSDAQLNPIDRKHVLSLVNDFEDGGWRFSKFQSFVWDNIAETALSKRERDSLVNHSLLTEAAKKLRLTDENKKDVGKGSEIAEIVLYGLMKSHYGALPVVPKIFYKQNSNDTVKGADSVHIVLEGEDKFSLWFGEAKFFNCIEDARLGEIIKSVDAALQTDKLKKENSIITSVSDLDTLNLAEAQVEKIKQTLSNRNSIDALKPILHVPILLLHECEITAKQALMNDGYVSSLVAYHKERANTFFKQQIGALASKVGLYSQIAFHLILFPVPAKDKIVQKFLENVKHYKAQ